MLSILHRLLDWRLEPVELIDCQNHFRSCETFLLILPGTPKILNPKDLTDIVF